MKVNAKQILDKCVSGLKKLKLRDVVYIVVILAMLGALASAVRSCKDNKSRYENNIEALTDSIKYLKSKSGETVVKKTVFEIEDIDELRQLNKQLYDEVQDLKNLVKLKNITNATQFSGEIVNVKHDTTFIVQHDTIKNGFNHNFAFNDEWRDLEGNVNYAQETLRQEIDERVGDCGIEDAQARISTKLVEMKRLHDDKATELNGFKSQQNRKSQLERELPSDRTKLQEISERLGKIQIAIAQLQTEEKNLQTAETQLRGELPFSTETEARNILGKNELQKGNLEQSIKDTQQALNKCEQEIAGLAGSIGELAKLIEEVPSLNVESENAKREELLQLKKAVDEKFQKIVITLANNHKVLQNMDRASGDLMNLEKEYQMKNLIAQTAEGRLSGKERINLETYVLMSYFERIILRANTRLMIMSSGQYELRRSNTSNGTAQIGLNLDVLDHYNGSTRDVKTLSGGESFMASLSLALGLSDEIQSTAGGIRLDTLFVDEGFGSLDEESLAQALKALASLTEGNRLVGIISHVAELKKINKQIEVTKDHLTYSHVRVIV